MNLHIKEFMLTNGLGNRFKKVKLLERQYFTRNYSFIYNPLRVIYF